MHAPPNDVDCQTRPRAHLIEVAGVEPLARLGAPVACPRQVALLRVIDDILERLGVPMVDLPYGLVRKPMHNDDALPLRRDKGSTQLGLVASVPGRGAGGELGTGQGAQVAHLVGNSLAKQLPFLGRESPRATLAYLLFLLQHHGPLPGGWASSGLRLLLAAPLLLVGYCNALDPPLPR